jgi:hypothetical protein
LISIILYGRNDSYGYNLHKRAALSLNCMAELLEAPDDEIIFVDYNTPDDFPTFPEAIADTLTERAKRCLRVLRVRASVHQRFADRTHLLALEPVARNVAVRRCNPLNRWILSTNTDIILVPREAGRSLTSIAADLPKGYWGLPRFEVPETLWESLNRRDPARVIATIGQWGWRYHLNEVVYGADFIRFDGPGDFQLVDRQDLCSIHGFHEEMLLGWHVDSNLAKRMSLLYDTVGDLSDRLFCYHCDHTRQVTAMHKHDAVENDSDQFLYSVERPDLPAQAARWGCLDADIEEVRLARSPAEGYATALDRVLPDPQRALSEAAYVGNTYGATGYSAEHVVPFLTDLFASAPRDWSVLWVGGHQRMFDLFCEAWRVMGFTGRVLIPEAPVALVAPGASAQVVPLDEALAAADAFVFDVIGRSGAPLSLRLPEDDERLLEVIEEIFGEITLTESDPRTRPAMPRRLIGINAIHNRFESLFVERVAAAHTPFATRLRHGFAFPAVPVDPLDWIGHLRPGSAGRLADGLVQARPTESGIVARGPKLRLGPGRYEVEVGLEAKLPAPSRIRVPIPLKDHLRGIYLRSGPLMQAVARTALSFVPGLRATLAARRPLRVTVEVARGSRVLAALRLDENTLGARSHRVAFEILPSSFVIDPLAEVDVRILSRGFVDFALTRLVIRPLAAPSSQIEQATPADAGAALVAP